MSNIRIDGPEGAACRCNNCGAVWHIDDLHDVADVQERIFAGEIVPAGQCPFDDCGALCYVVEDAYGNGAVILYDDFVPGADEEEKQERLNDE